MGLAPNSIRRARHIPFRLTGEHAQRDSLRAECAHGVIRGFAQVMIDNGLIGSLTYTAQKASQNGLTSQGRADLGADDLDTGEHDAVVLGPQQT